MGRSRDYREVLAVFWSLFETIHWSRCKDVKIIRQQNAKPRTGSATSAVVNALSDDLEYS